jgi:hypothetical protein
VASALAHELQHSTDIDLAMLGLLPGDYLELEARGFEVQEVVARALWPDALPNGTEVERQLAALVRLYERDGLDGIRAHLARDAAYLQMCGAL